VDESLPVDPAAATWLKYSLLLIRDQVICAMVKIKILLHFLVCAGALDGPVHRAYDGG
jgi:hypothetical protein